MLHDIAFSQYVRAVLDEVDEYQPATQGGRKHTPTRGVQLLRRTTGQALRGKAEVVTRNTAAHTRLALAGLSILLVEVESLTDENRSMRRKLED
jgi:hypothetical protein